MPHQNEHDDLKGPHKWSRTGGYEPVAAEVNESAEGIAGASELDDDPAKVAEAVEFVKSHGYNQEAAEVIVKREGVNKILTSRSEELAQKAKEQEVPGVGTEVMQPQAAGVAEKGDEDVTA